MEALLNPEQKVGRIEDADHIRKLIAGTRFDTSYYHGASDEDLVSRYNSEREQQLENLREVTSKDLFLRKDGFMGKMDPGEVAREFESYRAIFGFPDELMNHLDSEPEFFEPSSAEQTVSSEVEVIPEEIKEKLANLGYSQEERAGLTLDQAKNLASVWDLRQAGNGVAQPVVEEASEQPEPLLSDFSEKPEAPASTRIEDQWLAAEEANRLKRRAEALSGAEGLGKKGVEASHYERAEVDLAQSEAIAVNREVDEMVKLRHAEGAQEASEFVGARNEYITRNTDYLDLNGAFRKNNQDSAKLASVGASRKAYEEVRVTLAKKFYENKSRDIEAGDLFPDGKEKLKVSLRAEVLSEFFTSENKKLQSAQVEGWPPKERGVARKALEAYAKLPKAARWAIGATVSTGAAFAFGSAITMTAGVPLLFGMRFARGMLTGSVIQGLGKVVDSWWGKKTAKDLRSHEGTLAEKYKDNFTENLSSIGAENKGFVEAQAHAENWKNAGKIGAGIALGVGAAGVLSQAENAVGHFFSGGGGAHADQVVAKGGGNSGGPKVDETAVAKAREAAAQKAAQEAAERAAHETAIQEQTRVTELATVHKGEGLWNPVARQYEDVIAKDPTKFGLGANATKAQIHILAEQKTNLFLRNHGYIGENADFHVKSAGTKIFINENSEYGSRDVAESELSIHEFQKPVGASEQTEVIGGNRVVPAEQPHINIEGGSGATRPVSVGELPEASQAPQGFDSSFDGRGIRAEGLATEVSEANVHDVLEHSQNFIADPVKAEAFVVTQGEGIEHFTEDIEKYLDIKRNISLANQEQFMDRVREFTGNLTKHDQAVAALEHDNLNFALWNAHDISAVAWKRIEEAQAAFKETQDVFREFVEKLGVGNEYVPLRTRTLADIFGDPKLVLEHQELLNTVRELGPTALDQKLTLDEFLRSRISLGGFEKHTPFIQQVESWAPRGAAMEANAKAFEAYQALHGKLHGAQLGSLGVDQAGEQDGPLSLAFLHSTFAKVGYEEQEKILKSMVEKGLKSDIENYKTMVSGLEKQGVELGDGRKYFIDGIEESVKRLYELHAKSAEIYQDIREDYGFSQEIAGTPAYHDMTVGSVLSAENINERFKEFASVLESKKIKLIADSSTPEELEAFKATKVDTFIQQLASTKADVY